MASLSIYQDSKCIFNIEYVFSGRIDQVEVNSKIIFDRELNLGTKDWENELFKIIIKNKFHINRGNGLHAFIRPFIKKYTGTDLNG